MAVREPIAAELRAHGGSAKGMRIDLGVMRAEGTSE